MSNEKQLGLAFAQYNVDYDQKYPCGPGNNGQGWAGAVYPYVKSLRVYVCPDDIFTFGAFSTMSYAFNNNLSPNPHNSAASSPTNADSSFAGPASTGVLRDIGLVPGDTDKVSGKAGQAKIDSDSPDTTGNAGDGFGCLDSGKVNSVGELPYTL